jgi:hypothetical protein
LIDIADLQDYLKELQQILKDKVKPYELINPVQVLVAERQADIIENLSDTNNLNSADFIVKKTEDAVVEILT